MLCIEDVRCCLYQLALCAQYHSMPRRGLGKTVTSLALILTQSKKVLGCTLIVAPVSVLSSWAEHIEALCPVGFQCYTYHGTKRRKERAFLEKHAVVLTT